MDAAVSHSSRALPSVYSCIEALHACALKWMRGAPSIYLSRVRRATVGAGLAVLSASHGSRVRYNLVRAREAILPCLGVLRFLRLEGHASDNDVADACRRIDQILSGLEQLSAVPIEQWADLKLPPLELSEKEEPRSVSPTSNLDSNSRLAPTALMEGHGADATAPPAVVVDDVPIDDPEPEGSGDESDTS
jgi:hypothetical protein